ncbi:MAG: YitT family protein [Bacteroidota bacterium]
MSKTSLFYRYLTDFFFLSLGVACAAFGLESFLLPNSFIDGGVTGISLLIAEVTGWRLSAILVVLNIPFLLLARMVIGPRFAWRSTITIVLLAASLFIFNFPEVTQDKLLVSVFGGFFLGAGIGLSMRGGGVLDGTEILAIRLSRLIGAKVSDWIIIINVIIFGFAAYILSIEQALYSMLTYFVASKALDFVIDGIEEYIGITIISDHVDDIRRDLVEKMRAGVTIFKGRGGMQVDEETPEKDILYVVITRLEIRKIDRLIEDIDPNAFVTMTSINDVRGGMVRKRVPIEGEDG